MQQTKNLKILGKMKNLLQVRIHYFKVDFVFHSVSKQMNLKILCYHERDTVGECGSAK